MVYGAIGVRPYPAAAFACGILASVTASSHAQINSLDLSATAVNPGETITVSASYGSGVSAFVTTPYAVETDEVLPGFTYDAGTMKAKMTPANASSFTISTTGWKPGLYHLSLQASDGNYRDFAIKVGMPNSQFRIVEEYDGPVASGSGGLVQNLLALPDGSVLGGAFRSPGGADVGEVWEPYPNGVYNTRPLTFGERYLVNGQPTIIGLSSLNAATGTPGVFHNPGLRFSTNEGDSSTPDATAVVNVPLARAGFAHAAYEGPLTYRSIVHIPDGTTHGKLLATAYANFIGDDTLWRWTGPNANSNTINPNSKRLRSIAIQSTDGGHTWDYLSTIAADDNTGMEGYNETVMKRLPNGDLLALMRTGDEAWAGYGPGTGQLGDGWMDNPLMMARSTDDGATWSKPRRTGVESVSPDLAVMSDGTLVAGYGRPGHNLMFSVDGGNSWIDHYSMDPERYRGYTAVAEASPGVLLATYRAHDWLNPDTGTRQDVTRVKRLRVSRWGEGVLAYDSFDYDGATTLEDANGGDGFSGQWYADAALTLDADIELDGSSLAAPSGYGQAPEGGRLVGRNTSSRTAYRALESDSQLDLGTDQDYYASLLVRRTGSGPGSESFTFSLLSGTTSEVGFAISSAGTPTILDLGATASGTGTLGFGDVYLLAMKVSARANAADQAFLKLYGQNDVVNLTEPGSWNAVGNTELNNAIINRLGFIWGSEASLIYDIDELRLATTWEEAVILGGRRIRESGLRSYEPFNYVGNLAGADGGIGFDGGWHSDAALTQPASATLGTGSLSAPGGYSPDTEGNRIRGVPTDVRSIYRKLADSAQIDLGADQDYYVTLLFNRSDTGGAGSKGLTLSLLAGATSEIQAAVATSGNLSILNLGSTISNTGAPVGFDETFLMVLKIIASADGDDRVLIKLYGETDLVDQSDSFITWDLVGNGELNSAVIDRIGLSWGSASSLIMELDELRISTNWADALTNTITLGQMVPEPTSLMTLTPAVAGLLLRCRRHRAKEAQFCGARSVRCGTKSTKSASSRR